jgi:hypothetical protein
MLLEVEAASVRAVAAAVPRVRTIALGGALLLAFAVRVGLAWLHTTPDYFPDEYLYTELGRSFGAFHWASVRGSSAHFPALLQPLVTALAWRIDNIGSAFRTVQLIESAAFTLAAVPAYLLARRTGAGSKLAFAVAAGALLVPDALYSGFVLAEAIAYPLALAAIAAGVSSLAEPRRRTQVLFLVFAALATFARLQLGVVPLCFAAAAIAVGLRERRLRRTLREQSLVFGAIALAGIIVLAGVAARGLGYYAGARHLHFVPASIGRNLTVLLYAGGWATMPAAAVGLWVAVARPRSRAQAAFGWLTAFFGGALFFEAAVWGDTQLIQERYVFYLLPLGLVAFGVQATQGWPLRRVQALVAVGMLVLSARVPLSAWTGPGSDDHSPFLLAVQRLELSHGVAMATGLVAVLAGLFSVAAALGPWRPHLATPLLLGLALAGSAATLAEATSFDYLNSRIKVQAYLPAERSWIDAEQLGPATLLEAAGSHPTDGEEQLFWNRSVRSVALLPVGSPPDRLAATQLRIDARGTLLAHGRPLRGPLVVDGFGSTVLLQDARVVAAAPHDRLWLPRADARLRLYVIGRSESGWLWRSGRIMYWADRPGLLIVRVRGKDVHVGAHRVRGRATLRLPICARGRWSIGFTATLSGFAGGRLVGGHMGLPHFVAAAHPCG